MTVCFLSLVGLTMQGQGKAELEFKAKGCCAMCEDRILNALDVPGVRVAQWDQFKEEAFVVFKPKKISEDQIEQLVADAGHDTERFIASDEAYGALAACCLYRDGCSGCSEFNGHQDDEEHHHEGEDHEGHDDEDR